jgi:hypothetical protein
VKLNRRQFCSVAFTAPALAAQSAPPTPLIHRGFGRVSKLADGVYVTIANAAKGLGVFRIAASSWDANELCWWRVIFKPRAPRLK